jgi:phospholipid/cholesterol/gamma-HCH transport system permease protein
VPTARRAFAAIGTTLEPWKHTRTPSVKIENFLEVRRSDKGLELELTGEWRALRFAEIDGALGNFDFASTRRVEISTARLEALDLSGAWRLHEFIKQAHAAGVEVAFTGAPPDQLRLVDQTLKGESPPCSQQTRPIPLSPIAELEAPALRSLEFLGRHSVLYARDLVRDLAFLGRMSVTAARGLTSTRRLRPISIARHVYDTGITAIPIVSLIAFLISVIIAYMSAQQLRNFGAVVFVVDLVTIGVLRELGVLLTSIIVAGRSGSAFAAEIGSMKLNEEVDALYATGVDPFEALVLPRILGLVIALPLLTIIADIIGLAGGALLCRFLLDMPLTQYITRAQDAITATTFWVGVMKAPVFAILIAMAGCYRGMQVRDSSRELGRLTTLAVVQAIFLVIFADALFAILFLELRI